jgi:hypothetical protein
MLKGLAPEHIVEVGKAKTVRDPLVQPLDRRFDASQRARAGIRYLTAAM